LKSQNIFSVQNNPEQSINNNPTLTAFNLSDSSVVIGPTQRNTSDADNISRENILNKAQSMVNVSWTPKYNILDSVGNYTFLKGVKYKGIPYNYGGYQVNSASEFLSDINNSHKLYGNDCSGFVSIAWGISRQTTLSLLDAIKYNNKIDGKSISMVSWNDLKPGDALLMETGNGMGHIMIFVSFDVKDSDNLNVYEQNIGTKVPLEPLPVAREDIRSEKTLKYYGYFPISI